MSKRLNWEQKKIAIAQTMDMLDARHALPYNHPDYIGCSYFWQYLADAMGITSWAGTVRLMCRYCNENNIDLTWQNDKEKIWWKR